MIAFCAPSGYRIDGLTLDQAVVGRKNHYGSKSRRGTEVASRLYTILETDKLHDIDPAAYLHAAITAADRGELPLPWQFTPRS